ncbi:MAG: Caspase domain protein [bacterium ADurb.Bin429]|nr:MAG: Caspase domain protein [bacterium ADurb.Bin429]
MRGLAGIAGLLISVLLIIGCGGGEAPTQALLQGNIIQGHIYCPDTREEVAPEALLPVWGAVVTVPETGFSARTNAAGFYQVAVPKTGTYTLAANHVSFRDTVTVPFAVTGDLTEVDAMLGVGYYVLVGINDYLYITDLQGPGNDVEGMRATLPMFSGHTTVLKDRQATKQQIKKAFTEAALRMRENDYFVFYYSGHGGRDGTADYICPTDTVLTGYENDIMDSELRDWLKAMPDPARATIIIDACYAGAFFDGVESPRGESRAFVNPPNYRALKQTNCTVLAASAYNEYSWEDIDYLGVVRGFFSRHIVNALSFERSIADVNKDRLISARELYEYACSRTIADTQAQFLQTPQFQEGMNPVIVRY